MKVYLLLSPKRDRPQSSRHVNDTHWIDSNAYTVTRCRGTPCRPVSKARSLIPHCLLCPRLPYATASTTVRGSQLRLSSLLHSGHDQLHLARFLHFQRLSTRLLRVGRWVSRAARSFCDPSQVCFDLNSLIRKMPVLPAFISLFADDESVQDQTRRLVQLPLPEMQANPMQLENWKGEKRNACV